MEEKNQRERVGVLIAAFIVIAYVMVGPLHVAIVYLKGAGITFPSDWTASMLSLASAAFGFLVGKQTTGNNNSSPVAVTTEGEKPLSVVAAPVAKEPPKDQMASMP